MRFSGPAARLVHFLFAIFVVSSFWRRINLFNDRLPVREIAMNVITEMMWSNQSNFSASELHSYCGSKYKSTKFFESHFFRVHNLSAGSASSALPSRSSSGNSVYVCLLLEGDPDEDSGFVWVMENLKSHGISQFHFPDLESPEI